MDDKFKEFSDEAKDLILRVEQSLDKASIAREKQQFINMIKTIETK